jgi:hypothetical protein
MRKRKLITLEDRAAHAERAYARMLANVEAGRLDRDEIFAALTSVQTVGYIALKERKRNLLCS